MSDAEMLELVLERSARFERTIRRRDRREIIATGLGVLLLAPLVVLGPWLSRVGVLLVMAGGASVVVVLGRARRMPAPAPDRPLAEALRAEQARVRAQTRLLETVIWWYIAPLALGAVLIVTGLSGASPSTYGYIVVMLAFSIWVYRLNRRAVQRDLRPRGVELERQLRELEG